MAKTTARKQCDEAALHDKKNKLTCRVRLGDISISEGNGRDSIEMIFLRNLENGRSYGVITDYETTKQLTLPKNWTAV